MQAQYNTKKLTEKSYTIKLAASKKTNADHRHDHHRAFRGQSLVVIFLFLCSGSDMEPGDYACAGREEGDVVTVVAGYMRAFLLPLERET